MFSQKELNLEEHELREQIRSLPDVQRHYYHRLESRRLKSPARYLTLNRLFPLGLHHFYLRRWVRGLINISLTASGLVMLLATSQPLYGIMLLLAMVIIEIPQLLNARHLVHSQNNQAMALCLARAEKYQPKHLEEGKLQ